jgi:hypothetical protein
MPNSFHVLHNWLFTINQSFSNETTNTKVYVSNNYPNVIIEKKNYSTDSRWRSSRVWCNVMWCRDTNISEKPLASIFNLQPWRQRQHIPPKHWHLSITLYSTISLKIVILTVTAIRTSNLIMISNNVRQHKCFIIQGSYIGYMFWLINQSSSGLFSRLSHKVLCIHWDPSVCTSIKYIESYQLPKEVWCTYCVTIWLKCLKNF